MPPTPAPDPYTLSFDPSRIQLDRVHAWLRASYWSPDIRRDVVERALANSIVVGVYLAAAGGPNAPVQVGVARAVTDRASFAWICDVYVDEAHRARGIARRMVRALLDHPDLLTLRRFLLATRDAHAVYGALGFNPLAQPDRWMELKPAGERWKAGADNS